MLLERPEASAPLDCLSAAKNYFRHYVMGSDPTRETLWVAHVDRLANCLHLATYAGDATSVPVSIRPIVADILRVDSAGIILAHNHPSGDPRASDSDRRLTRHLATVANALDCAVLDHLIFAGEDCQSLRSLGLL
jgi:DNA repair protein RadC